MKELVRKLSVLKDVRPESSWKQETRDILLAQISNAVGKEVRVGLLDVMAYNFKNFFSFLPSTAWAVICLAIILTGGSFGALAANNSRPGDDLYIAKTWKEKIQLLLTFNQEDKAKLDMKLASIHAMEITEVLSDPNFNAATNPKKAEELAENFKQEIDTVKQRYSEINQMQQKNSVPPASGSAVNNTSSNLAANDDNAKVGIGNLQKATDSKVYGVESGKANQGLQFYDPNANLKKATSTVKVSSSPVVPLAVSSNSVSNLATSTPAASSTDATDINVSLDKATESFDTKDFSGAKDILNQVGMIISKIDSGSVKGATEAGSAVSGVDQAGTSGSSSGSK